MNYGDESRHTNWCKNTTGTQRKIKQGDAHHTHADAPVTRACKPIRASCARSTGHEWTPNYNNNKINENYINLISFCINIPWLIVMVCRVTLAQHTHFFPFFFFVFFPFSRLASLAAKGSMRAFFYCYCWLILFFFCVFACSFVSLPCSRWIVSHPGVPCLGCEMTPNRVLFHRVALQPLPTFAFVSVSSGSSPGVENPFREKPIRAFLMSWLFIPHLPCTVFNDRK